MVSGAHAGALFSSVRGGGSTMNELEEASNRLNQAGLAITDIVLNDFKSSFARYGGDSKSGMRTYLESQQG